MSSCLFAQFLLLFLWSLHNLLSNKCGETLHSLSILLYYANRRNVQSTMFVSRMRNKDVLSRRRGAIGKIAPRAQLNGQILWSSVFPTISIFLFFLLLFHYRLFQHSLNRDCSLSPQFTSRYWSGLMIARAYVCAYVLYKTRWYRACLLLLCRAHEVCEFTAWSVARENKSTNCRLTDSGQTRERRGTSL